MLECIFVLPLHNWFSSLPPPPRRVIFCYAKYLIQRLKIDTTYLKNKTNIPTVWLFVTRILKLFHPSLWAVHNILWHIRINNCFNQLCYWILKVLDLKWRRYFNCYYLNKHNASLHFYHFRFTFFLVFNIQNVELMMQKLFLEYF